MTAELRPDSLIPALRDPIAKLIEAKKKELSSGVLSPKSGSQGLAGSILGSLKGSAKGTVPGSMLASKDGPVLN